MKLIHAGGTRWLAGLLTGLLCAHAVQAQSFDNLLDQSMIPAADPQLISKLASGNVAAIGRSSTHMSDLFAVLIALSDSGCKYEARKGEPTINPADVISRGLQSGAGLVQLRRVYSSTLFELNKHDCDSDRIHVIARTAMLAITGQASSPTSSTKPAAEPAPLQSHYIEVWSARNVHRTSNPELERAFADKRVLVCTYPGTYAPARRMAWYDAPPKYWRSLRNMEPKHPIADIGALQLKECPKQLAEFEAARERGLR